MLANREKSAIQPSTVSGMAKCISELHILSMGLVVLAPIHDANAIQSILLHMRDLVDELNEWLFDASQDLQSPIPASTLGQREEHIGG